MCDIETSETILCDVVTELGDYNYKLKSKNNRQKNMAWKQDPFVI